MDISESEEKEVREHVLSLTGEEIIKSAHLCFLDLENCDIELIIEACIYLLFDVISLRDRVSENDNIREVYLKKNAVLKKLRECQELNSLMLEMYLCEYMEKTKIKKLN